MWSVTENLERVRNSVPDGVTLVAVSKFHPAEAVAEAYAAGQRIFGESRALELAEKAATLPADIEWHFIGHLQRNKVRKVVAAASVIQSIDSRRILEAVDAEAALQGRRIDVLLQAHVAAEETKTGFTPAEIMELATDGTLGRLKAVTVTGIMGMATNTDDEARIAADFDALRSLFATLASGPMAGNPRFATLSMGMSDDRGIAIAHGSTMVRVGSDIFGHRNY